MNDPRPGSSRPNPRPPERGSRPPRDPRDGRRDERAPAVSPAAAKSGVPHGATELGWLPDLVYTGEKFEAGLAFFADTVGRLTRFSRDPNDLAVARRLEGQAALPGLINAHSHAFQRVLRGRAESRAREAEERVLARIGAEDVFDTARMVFMEMLLSGITCIGEFQYLHHPRAGAPAEDANSFSREIIRAAHDVGVRIGLLRTAYARSAPPRFRTAAAEEFLRETEALRVAVEKDFPADEAWVGIGLYSVPAVGAEQLKPIGTYARAQRMRVHAHVSATPEENAAAQAEFGRTPVALLAEHGLVDKRFTAVDALHLSDDEIKLLGTARAIVCACPSSAQQFGRGAPPIEKLMTAGAGIAFGSDHHPHIDLLKDARALEYQLRSERHQPAVFGPDAATALFHAATVNGARSLGATGGALEVGRPADFFTVNLYEPSIAGADSATLMANVVFSLERRAIRDVWVGGRQRIANGRHAQHGPIVGRFVEVQKRIWAA